MHQFINRRSILAGLAAVATSGLSLPAVARTEASYTPVDLPPWPLQSLTVISAGHPGSQVNQGAVIFAGSISNRMNTEVSLLQGFRAIDAVKGDTNFRGEHVVYASLKQRPSGFKPIALVRRPDSSDDPGEWEAIWVTTSTPIYVQLVINGRIRDSILLEAGIRGRLAAGGFDVDRGASVREVEVQFQALQAQAPF